MHILTTTLQQAQHSARWKMLSCILLTLLADWLFFNAPAGWTIGLFGACLLAAMLLHNQRAGAGRLARLVILLNSGLIAALIEAPNLLAFGLLLTGLISLAVLKNPDRLADSRVWLKQLLLFLPGAATRLGKDIKVFHHISKAYALRPGERWRLLRNWLLPLLCSAIFISLFAFANPVIAEWLNNLDWKILSDVLSPSRFLFWMVVAVLCWILIRLKISHNRIRSHPLMPVTENSIVAFLFSPASILRSLAIFNVLFAIQSGLDVTYLWAGGTPAGLSHADYAHRGAYPLIVTALLAAVFVLIALKPGSRSGQVATIRILVYAWIAQNILLVMSSLWRTHLYVEMYSLTLLRLAAMIWMGLVAVGLLWILLRILLRKSGLWLINANVLSLLAVLYVCSFMNFNVIIAGYNVEHSRELSGTGSSLDLIYLESLGHDAIPALQRFRNAIQFMPLAARQAGIIEADLQLDLYYSITDWRSWTWRDYRLFMNHSAAVRQNNRLPYSAISEFNDAAESR